jgi:hypothetical protein
MTPDFRDPNPYSSPTPFAAPSPNMQQVVAGRVTPPAIALLVVGVLGIAVSLFNVAYAFGEPVADPNAPAIVQEMQRGSKGPLAIGVQTVFVLVNGLIILGSVQMMRLRMWGLAVAASIVAMLNFGTFCCVLGLPIGVWSLVILMLPEVKAGFQSSGL